MLPDFPFALKQDGWLVLHMRTAARLEAVPSHLLTLHTGIARLRAEGRDRKFPCFEAAADVSWSLSRAWLSLWLLLCELAMGEAEKFHYIYSCDLDINVQLKM